MPTDPNYIHADTPHEKSVQSFNRYSCHNRTMKAGYYAPDRVYSANGAFVTTPTYIEDKSSRECRYDFRATDGLCEGCKK